MYDTRCFVLQGHWLHLLMPAYFLVATCRSILTQKPMRILITVVKTMPCKHRKLVSSMFILLHYKLECVPSYVVVKKASKQEFDRINAHFTKQWHHRKGACGQLHEVLVITNLKLKNQFEKYVSSLSVKNISQHYHGTSLKCAVYQTCTVCSDQTCGVCGVSQKGMLPNFKATNIKFQRFGNGFYLAPNSSKCHDYTQGYDKYRAMLLFDVAEGNRYTVTNDQTTLKAPPQGYDSVYGQSGSALNFDEIVLYKSEALLPTHILIYMKDGIHKIAK